MSGRTKCATCNGWYGSGYARCPECVTPTPDAVAFAQQQLDRCYESAAERGGYDVSAYCEARNALIAAVRAECAAKYSFAVLSASTLGAARDAVERYAKAEAPEAP